MNFFKIAIDLREINGEIFASQKLDCSLQTFCTSANIVLLIIRVFCLFAFPKDLKFLHDALGIFTCRGRACMYFKKHTCPT